MQKKKENVRLMFDEIAGKYDFLNHLFTLNTDKVWRKKIINYIKNNNISHSKILDIASGTGDMTKELLKLPAEEVHSCDISEKMLEIQMKKINDSRLIIATAEASDLPYIDNYFDVITITFGVRNFENLENSLNEIRRVLKKNGFLIILEMFKNDGVLNNVFDLYFGKFMPFVGNKVSKSKYAYNYLFKSVKTFYSKIEFITVLQNHHFTLIKESNNFMNFVHTLYFRKNA